MLYNRYHTPRPDVHRIVGVLVWPSRCVVFPLIKQPLIVFPELSFFFVNSHAELAFAPPYCDINDQSQPVILSETTNTLVKYTYRIRWSVSCMAGLSTLIINATNAIGIRDAMGSPNLICHTERCTDLVLTPRQPDGTITCTFLILASIGSV